ncbi:MAG: hypothetical protein PVI98_13620 [Burkholderiales bacterium]
MFDFLVRPHSFLRSRKLITCVALLSLTFSAEAAAHGVTLKFRGIEPFNPAFSENFLQPWAEKLHEDSRGKINLLIEPTDRGADLFQAVLDRDADVVWLSLRGPASSHPRFMLFAAPLAGNSAGGSSMALWSWVEMNDLAFREFSEMRILAVARHDEPVFHMRERALSSLSDLKGARIAIPTPDAETFLAHLGASPVVLPASQFAGALSQNKVDGLLLSWSSLAALELEALVTAHSQPPAGAPWPYTQLSLLMMNPDAYRGLTDDLKQVMRAENGIDVSARIGNIFDDAAQAAHDSVAARGETINTLPDSDLALWREAADAALETRSSELDAIGLNGQELIEQVRALIKRYDPAR